MCPKERRWGWTLLTPNLGLTSVRIILAPFVNITFALNLGRTCCRGTKFDWPMQESYYFKKKICSTKDGINSPEVEAWVGNIGWKQRDCVLIKNTKNVWKFTASVDLSKTSRSGIPKSITHNIPSTLFYATSVHMSNKRRWSIALAVFSIFQPTDMLSTGVSLITTTLHQACANYGQRAACSFYPQISQGFLNTFTAIVDLSRFNNSCLKSPASTLVDLIIHA